LRFALCTFTWLDYTGLHVRHRLRAGQRFQGLVNGDAGAPQRRTARIPGMNRSPARFLILAPILIAACGEQPSGTARISREPVSIRGWISDVVTGPRPTYQVLTGDVQRKILLFQQTNVSIEGAPFASGGVAENGAFIILDVPPGDVTLTFSAPGIPGTGLELRGVPPNADVYLDEIVLTQSEVQLIQPEKVLVRVPGERSQANREEIASSTLTGARRLRVVRVPLREMMDRRDYPMPRAPGSPQP